MPEKPEVITVSKKLESKILNKKILDVNVLYNNIIEYPTVDEFTKQIRNQEVKKISTRGKWIVIELTKQYLLIHLRMEGKFFYRNDKDPITKHEHVIFKFSDFELRFSDVRKFAKMKLIDKDKLLTTKPYTELGYEVWDKDLTSNYLIDKFKNKNIPIKTALLDQSIIAGIGNIYADEILFLSRINPITKAKDLNNKQVEKIINNSINVLDEAIKQGGTTIRSYTSEEGVTGLFQNELYVHQREKMKCKICNCDIIKIRVGGRGTYYCPKCQK